MSDSTFSQPTSSTAGLQNHDLERDPKELYPAPDSGRLARKRRAAMRFRNFSRGRQKEHATMNKSTIEAMVGTLSTSVTDIAASNASNRAELLQKSVTEFKDALMGQVDALEKMAQPMAGVSEEPLYKGLGCVGRIANLVGGLANQIQEIKLGHSTWQKTSDMDANQIDPATPELVEHLQDLLAHAEIILRAAVNECVEPMDEGDDSDGMLVIHVPADGGGHIVAKTHLPEDLAKFAADPAILDAMLMEAGFHALAKSGVDVQALAKSFEENTLAKDAMGGDMSAGTDPTGDPDDGSGLMPTGDDDGDPLQTLARLAALMMVVIDNLQQQVDGTGGASDPSGEDDGSGATAAGGASDSSAAGGAPGASAVDPAQNAVAKSVETGDLSKIAGDETLAKMLKERGFDLEAMVKIADDNAALRGQVAEFEATVPELLKMAQAPKAPLVTPGAMQKSADDALNPAPKAEEDLSKLSPTERSLRLTKISHLTTGTPVKF